MKGRAIFLLVIFLLHIVVGFGCAVVVQGEHPAEHDKVSFAHQHNDRQHDHPDTHEHKIIPVHGIDFSKQDSCCKKLVNELTIESKLIPTSAKASVVLPVIGLVNHIYNLMVPAVAVQHIQAAYTDYRYRPPNEDIRISIQSFQI